jgi:hypothetical protein
MACMGFAYAQINAEQERCKLAVQEKKAIMDGGEGEDGSKRSAANGSKRSAVNGSKDGAWGNSGGRVHPFAGTEAAFHLPQKGAQ